MAVESLHQDGGGDDEEDLQRTADDPHHKQQNHADSQNNRHSLTVGTESPAQGEGQGGQTPQDQAEADCQQDRGGECKCHMKEGLERHGVRKIGSEDSKEQQKKGGIEDSRFQGMSGNAGKKPF